MGGGASKADALDQIIKKELKLTLDEMGLKKKDVLPFYKEYNKIDLDGSGSIQIDEIFQSHKIPLSEWGKRVFMAMDSDGSGSVSFAEFYIGMWNYCAADMNLVQKLAFDLADEDMGGKLSIDEIRQLLILIHGKGPSKKSAAELNKKVHSVMKVLDNDRSGTVTFAEWQKASKSIQSTFKPAMELQTALRKAYFGKGFWGKASKHRISVLGNKDLIQMQNENYPRVRKGSSLKKELSMRAESRKGAMQQDDYDSGSECDDDSD